MPVAPTLVRIRALRSRIRSDSGRHLFTLRRDVSAPESNLIATSAELAPGGTRWLSTLNTQRTPPQTQKSIPGARPVHLKGTAASPGLSKNSFAPESGGRAVGNAAGRHGAGLVALAVEHEHEGADVRQVLTTVGDKPSNLQCEPKR